MLVMVRIGDEEHRLAWDEWEERVRSGRVPPTALVQFEAVTGHEWRRADELEMYRSLRNESALAWQGRFTSSPPPLVTALLVGVQIRIWWAARLPEVATWLVFYASNWAPPTLEDGEAWRLLTMGAVQIGLAHLVLNMLWLAYTGWNLERALGRANLALLFGASVLGGSLLSMFATPENPSLGASGGVFGLVAASVVFGFLRPELLPERGRRLFGLAMLPYLVVMFASGLTNEGTDNWSHLGGLLAGGTLALLLDPDTLQRRPGWNRWIQGTVITSAASLLVLMGLLGPRVHPLVDAERAAARGRARVATAAIPPPPPVHRTVEYEVPMGWKRGTSSARDLGWVSPHAERAWAVDEVVSEDPLTADALLGRWFEALARAWPDAEIVEPPAPATVGGTRGEVAVVRIPDEAPRVAVVSAAARGTSGLLVVWEVEEASQRRLEPLQRRLRDAVVWNEPMSLVRARVAVERNPGSVRNRSDYASELASYGQGGAAVALWEELVTERPEDEALWLGLLDASLRSGDDPHVVEARWSQALGAVPSPRVALAVVRGLDDGGRGDHATALLDLAWIHHPGKRTLRRERARRGLSTALDGTHAAIQTLDLLTGLRLDEPPPPLPLTLEGARTWSVARRESRRRLAAHLVTLLEEGDPAAPDALIRLREGGPAHDPTTSAVDLAMDLEVHLAGGEVGWIPEGTSLRGDIVQRISAGDLAPCEEGEGWCATPAPPG